MRQGKWKSITKVPEPRKIKIQLHGENQSTRMLRNFCAEKRCATIVLADSLTAPRLSLLAELALLVGARTMTTKLAMFDSPVTSRKNFVLMWEQQPGATYSLPAQAPSSLR